MTRRGVFGSLCAMVFLVNLARVVFAPLVEPLQDAFGVGPATVGLIVTLVWVGSAIPRIPTGYLLTIYPRHTMVLATGVMLTLSSVVATLANSIATLAIGAVLLGTASGAYFVAAHPLIAELYTERVGRALGIHGTAAQLSAVIAAPMVSLALFVSWRLVFVAIGLGALASTVYFTLMARRTEFPAASGADRDFLGAIRAEWSLIVLGVVVFGATSFVWQGLFNFYPSYMEARGFTPGTARNLLTVVFAAGVPAFWVSGILVDRVPSVPYLAGIIGTFIGSVLLLTVTESLLGIIVVSALVGYVIHSLYPAADAVLLSAFPDEHRGGAYAMFSGGMMLGQSLGSWLVGELVERGFAYDAVFQGLAVSLAMLVVTVGGLLATDRIGPR
ncbi:MFS transporter [Natronorarus salvus]|uniref:MFS transporter n=1 Tax=Natronorarus salvus TaxID=3117733 RepID=UPI002F263CC6